MIKNLFLVLAKLGHECFKLSMLDISECLLELAINKIETNSLRLKMVTLSTLSACYWRQSKFNESINCMNLELEMTIHLNKSSDPSYKNNQFLNNIYRLYGNLASAYQRLNKMELCLENFQMQLDISLVLKEKFLILNTYNSIGICYNKLKEYNKSLEYFEKSSDLIKKYTDDEIDKFLLKKIKLKQNNLIGDCFLKMSVYDKARTYFLKQLDISSELMYEHQNLKLKQSKDQNELKEIPIDDLNQHWYQDCLAIFNLALISSKLKNFTESVDYFEKCLAKLQSKENKNYQIIELNGRIFIGLINNCLNLKDNLRAALYAHSMLDFTLKEMNKLNKTNNDQKEEYEPIDNQCKFKYLKFLEMSACSKLASCYWKQNRFDDALKLYQREAELAKQMNNTFFLTRSYSHMAQIHFNQKQFEKSIGLYKQVLHSIEINLINKNSTQSENNENLIEKGKHSYMHKNDRLPVVQV